MNTLIWNIFCRGTPTVTRHCKKCGQARAFVCSDCFRVNAQKRMLDVWLIYKCPQCDDTWNAAVLSRVSPQSIPAKLLDGFHRNDEELARMYALDEEMLRRCGAAPDVPEWEVAGETPPAGERVLIELVPECALPVRVAAVLRAGLGISRSKFEKLAADGRICVPDGGDIARMKLGRGAVVEVEL